MPLEQILELDSEEQQKIADDANMSLERLIALAEKVKQDKDEVSETKQKGERAKSALKYFPGHLRSIFETGVVTDEEFQMLEQELESLLYNEESIPQEDVDARIEEIAGVFLHRHIIENVENLQGDVEFALDSARRKFVDSIDERFHNVRDLRPLYKDLLSDIRHTIADRRYKPDKNGLPITGPAEAFSTDIANAYGKYGTRPRRYNDENEHY